MYLSLPLPSTSMRSMTISVMKSYGDIQLSVVTVNVPKDGKYSDLINILSTACSLGADETLLVAEVLYYTISFATNNYLNKFFPCYNLREFMLF